MTATSSITLSSPAAPVPASATAPYTLRVGTATLAGDLWNLDLSGPSFRDAEAIYLLHIGKPGPERLKDRLPVRVSIPDELSRAVVPHFVLQPLVENAFEHGIARKAGPGKVEIAPSASTECCSSR